MLSISPRAGAFLALFCCAMLVSCSSSKSRVGGALGLDTDLKLNFRVASNINPDGQQQPSPLFLRLYELESPEAFEKADFIDLYERDESVLGGSLISRQQLDRFIPGEDRADTVVLKPGTRYVGLYAEFLQYRDSKYKVVFQVTENNVIKNRVQVQIAGNKMWLPDS